MSADRDFAALIDRILRCRVAEDVAKDDTKEVYAELKAKGYDKTATGALITELRKKDRNPDKFTERSAMLDLYRDAYERAKGSLAHTHTREGNEYAAAKGAATRRLDDFGSVQDGLKMSSNGLSAGVAEQQNDTVHVSVTDETGGESAATNSPERAQGIPAGSHDQRHELVEGPEDQLEKEPLVAADAVASVSAPNSPSAVHPTAENTGAVVSSSAAAPVPNPHSSEPTSSQAETKTAGGVTPPASPAPNSPAHGPCDSIARKTPKTEPALDALAGDLGSTPCKGQNATPPANHSDDAPVNERCLKQGSCKFARHPHKITCSDCGSAFIKKRVGVA